MRVWLIVATILLTGCVADDAPGVREHGVNGDPLSSILPSAAELPEGFVVGYEPSQGPDTRTRIFDYTLDDRGWAHQVAVGVTRHRSEADAATAFDLLRQNVPDGDVRLNEADRFVAVRQYGPGIDATSERVFARAGPHLLWAFVDFQGAAPEVHAETLVDGMVWRLLEKER